MLKENRSDYWEQNKSFHVRQFCGTTFPLGQMNQLLGLLGCFQTKVIANTVGDGPIKMSCFERRFLGGRWLNRTKIVPYERLSVKIKVPGASVSNSRGFFWIQKSIALGILFSYSRNIFLKQKGLWWDCHWKPWRNSSEDWKCHTFAKTMTNVRQENLDRLENTNDKF